MEVDLAIGWMRATADAVAAASDELTRLDAAIGDGDHGVNLTRGFTAVAAALEAGSFTSAGEVFVKAGSTLISKVGGASGPLYGSALRSLGKALPPGPTVTPADLAAGLHAGLEAVRKLGGAEPGDKTIVDAWKPAADAFEAAVAAGGDLTAAAGEAAVAAREGARATAGLLARKGRASYLGERSVGHQDPGATSAALLFRALSEQTGNSG
ncbi:putative dihydroxyacetone kinase subunit 2 [Actinoplanes missouriensis 431]|uniref:Putative dihydroxyacetone kinase subunit 2 n=1 Tax=Actinoplanes missouriensis (strain ATCC 14538 / DSM 43046 / CBS 188.64 / JCM 3121 / NBRC 102363 / NCIMB 12654 / NRRL B-3342 / UNCC 431) TaxID=512565 RepID=I0HCV6_ACTM4|nr:dihydroxyacetone kinase subunit DhaL [Actinoplanes missouriensis]BAL90843.1 putative dihydroxyacetone kinase subunit 2 [Actinoplanes missouriensis 431]